MVTTSASGLDPDITDRQRPGPGAARGGGPRHERGGVLALVAKHTAGRELGFLGEPAVNVLQLNLALDAAQGAASP